MNGPDLDDDLALAHEMADAAAEIAFRHFGDTDTATIKSDGTPVTAADLEVEAALSELLAQHRPEDAILSEEAGSSGSSHRRWILDPIDGTVRLARGELGWSTYIALEVEGNLQLGLINQPADRRRYWTGSDHRALAAVTEAGRVVGEVWEPTVSTCDDLRAARFMALPPTPTEDLERLRAVATQVPNSPDFFTDMTEGRLDFLFSQGGAIWDHAAEVAIVEAAGGRFRDPRGGRRLDLRGGTYSNAALDQQIGQLLGRW